jgi:hypothetical protein
MPPDVAWTTRTRDGVVLTVYRDGASLFVQLATSGPGAAVVSAMFDPDEAQRLAEELLRRIAVARLRT